MSNTTPLRVGGIFLLPQDQNDSGYEDNIVIPMPPLSSTFQNQIDKYIAYINGSKNKNVRRPDILTRIRHHMEWVYGRNTQLFCVDIEAWERDTNVVTEIGVSIYDPAEQEFLLTPVIKTTHIIIEQHQNRRNGRFVPDHMNNFLEGESVVLPLEEARAVLQALVDKYFGEWATRWCTFVGHDLQNDIDYLRKIGISMPDSFLRLDTQKLFAYTHGTHGASLQNALRAVKQPFSFLHNAGNDAYFTVMLALKLCDPHTRKLLSLDLLKPGENLGDKREYVKVQNNKSLARYQHPDTVLRDL